jgi:hypothetical protein
MKILGILLAVFVLSVISYFTLYIMLPIVKVFGLANSSLATRGRFKTWEGEISQGMSGSQIFFLCNGQRQTSNY